MRCNFVMAVLQKRDKKIETSGTQNIRVLLLA